MLSKRITCRIARISGTSEDELHSEPGFSTVNCLRYAFGLDLLQVRASWALVQIGLLCLLCWVFCRLFARDFARVDVKLSPMSEVHQWDARSSDDLFRELSAG